jgi:hypothetical protein
MIPINQPITKPTNMSRVINKKSTQQHAQKKCCVVCRTAGKSEAEWQSHFVRESKDPNSRVVCPTVLGHNCEYCGKKGHMPSKCSLREKHMKQQSTGGSVTETALPKPSQPKTVAKQSNAANVFYCLEEVSDDESEPVKKPEPKCTVLNYKKLNWADCESSDDEDDAESYFK